MSGIRIIDVDAPRSMEYQITGYKYNKRKVTQAEPFYSLENALSRGPDVMADEFRQIQDEAFRVQQKFYYVLQDALNMGLSKRDVKKILKARGLGKREIRQLFRGKFTPANYNKDLMDKRYKKAKRAYPDEQVIKSYFYPKAELNRVIREYKNKSLKYPEDEGGSILDTIKDAIISPAGAEETESEPIIDTDLQSMNRIETPPLPKTPQPARQMAGLASLQKNPMTGLTRTQSALLSPSEQVIARRT